MIIVTTVVWLALGALFSRKAALIERAQQGLDDPKTRPPGLDVAGENPRPWRIAAVVCFAIAALGVLGTIAT